MTKKNFWKIFALISASTLALGACTNTPTKTEGAGLQVTTAFYPLTYLVEEIGGEKVDVTDLTPAGTDPHSAELSPSNISAMQKAQAVFYLESLSPAIDEAIISANLKNVINVAEHVSLITQEEIADHSENLAETTTATTETEHDHEGETASETHDHETEATEATETTENHDHEHNHGIYDPHFWTDPARLAALAPVVAAELSKLDSANADTYAANAQKVANELTTLASDFKQKLQSSQCATNSFVVTHLAFGYLALENNLEQIGIAGFDPETEPTPARIAQIKTIVSERHIHTIFTTSDAESKAAAAVAAETGAAIAVLDPAATQRNPEKDYQTVMSENFTLLLSALECE